MVSNCPRVRKQVAVVRSFGGCQIMKVAFVNDMGLGFF